MRSLAEVHASTVAYMEARGWVVAADLPAGMVLVREDEDQLEVMFCSPTGVEFGSVRMDGAGRVVRDVVVENLRLRLAASKAPR